MTTKQVRVAAKDIKVGDRIKVPTGMGSRIVEVKGIRVNPNYGWFGFISELNGCLSFHGWHKPDSKVVREESAQ